jgi:hypothetical protein
MADAATSKTVFYTDWMRLNESVQKTAEEIRERRDLRVGAMSAFVPRSTAT